MYVHSADATRSTPRSLVNCEIIHVHTAKGCVTLHLRRYRLHQDQQDFATRKKLKQWLNKGQVRLTP